MNREEIVIIVDEVEQIDNDKLKALNAINNTYYTFSEVLRNIEIKDECKYLLVISKLNNLDINQIEQFKEEIACQNESLILHFSTQGNEPTLNYVLSHAEDINMCLIKKELAFKVNQKNNLRVNIDMLYTELILRSTDIKIVNNERPDRYEYLRRCSIDTDIKRTLNLIYLYEENSYYLYHDLRYIKDMRRIINKLKILTHDKKKTINYVKMLQPLTKEVVNLNKDKLSLMEELLINQINNKEFEAAIKTLKYLNGDRPTTQEGIVEVNTENEFYKMKCEEILTSKSWYITKPLREPKIFLKKIKKKLER